MKYCVKCGCRLNTDAQYCNACGMKQPYVPPELLENRVPVAANPPMPPAPYRAPVKVPPVSDVPVNTVQTPVTALVPVYYTPLPRHKKGAIPCLIWSLILVPFFNIIGTPLAVIAAMLCLSADADDADFNNDKKSDIKISKAAILCIIATIVDVATLIFLVAKSVVVINGSHGL